MARGECYVVFVGRKPGIYSSWQEAEPNVTGYPGNVHRSFRTLEAGVDAWVDWVNRHPNGGGSQRRPVGEAATPVRSHTQSHAGMALAPMVSHGAVVHMPSASAEASSSSNGVGAESFGEGKSGLFFNSSNGCSLSSLQEAVAALEGRVSQLEVDKWELCLGLAQSLQELSGLVMTNKIE
ncbi:hypothetical protein PIB30_033479 [Stylosanthes scabra]|uniref:Ribonuclease H1 N-terminal domain-containing protein n=1 Tax=Stylosanthes scabra TaxID=79078 RepID=A0ABU6XBM5_9FABA|nr:hypothetical protein [Stylosanthes scabra]